MGYAILLTIVLVLYCLCEYDKNAFNKNLLVDPNEMKVILVIYEVIYKDIYIFIEAPNH